MRPLALLVLLAAGPAAAQGSALGGPRSDRPTFAPVQTSVPVAYLASVGATGLLVGTGLALDALFPAPPPGAYDDGTHLLYESGTLIAVIGGLLGPSVGNLTLGAGDDVGRAYVFKAVGAAAGGGLLLLALGTTAGCVAAAADGCGAAEPLLVAAVVAAAAGLVTGTAYDLATIPRNAARARAAGPGLSVQPVAGLRGSAPVLGLRASF